MTTLPPHLHEVAASILTRRQLQVLKLHAAGHSVRRIALALDIAPSTAQDHLTRARHKLTLALEHQKANAA